MHYRLALTSALSLSVPLILDALLTRTPGETIYFGEGEARIAVTVLEVHGNAVKVGITAPRDVRPPP